LRATALGLLGLALPLAAPGAARAQELDTQNRITPVVEVVRRARPAVVYIQTNVPRPVQDFWGRVRNLNQTKSGSGAVIYEDGYIVTNNHVIADADRIIVSFDVADDARKYEAKLISREVREDLALLKIEGDAPFPTIPLGTSGDLMLGEEVIAIGNPYGQTHTVSRGIVSGLHRNVNAPDHSFENLIQTDASINPGNSGGPLLNINGELVGINVAVNTAAENIGFAIPIDRVKKVLNDHLLSPAQAAAWLGFEVDLDKLTVEEVFPDGPAATAGLRPGDRLLSINRKPLLGSEDYRLAFMAIQPEDKVELQVARGREQRELGLRAWNRLDGYLYSRLGMTVEPIRIGRGFQPYLRVTAVQPDGPANLLGLAPHDVIEAVQPQGWRPKRLQGSEELAWLVSRLQPGHSMTVEIWRDDDGDGVFEKTVESNELYRGELTLR
jgi:serine protease Do